MRLLVFRLGVLVNFVVFSFCWGGGLVVARRGLVWLGGCLVVGRRVGENVGKGLKRFSREGCFVGVVSDGLIVVCGTES